MRSRMVGGAAAFSPIKESPPADKAAELEVRPGGMLVQKRSPDSAAAVAAAAAPVPTIRVKVKHATACHEIYINGQTSFGELKKVLAERTGIHPLDMKVLYKDRARDSAAFLDTAGVKDKSKLVLEEDPTAKAKRLLEMRRADKMEKAAKAVSAISLEVDRIASKVSALEVIVNKGGRVVETDVTNLIESLMNELIKLDDIAAEGDAKLHRRLQIRRVQKYVEALDAIKIKNATSTINGPLSKQQAQHQIQPRNHHLKRNLQQQHPIQPQHQQQLHRNRDSQGPLNPFEQQNGQPTNANFRQQPHVKCPRDTQPSAVMTTNWETFDSFIRPSAPTPSSSTTTASSTASSTPHASFDWELF